MSLDHDVTVTEAGDAAAQSPSDAETRVHRAADAVAARMRGDYDTAAALFSEAAHQATTTPERLHHLLRRIPCLMMINRQGEAKDVIARVVAEARTARDLPSLVDALSMLADSLMFDEQFAAAAPVVGEALHVAQQLPSEPHTYQVIHNLAVTLSAYGLHAQALELFDRSLRLADHDADRQCSYANMALAHLHAALIAGDVDERDRLVHDAMYVATAALDPQADEEISSRCTALSVRSVLLGMIGHHESAERDALQAIDIGERIGSVEDLAIAYAGLALCRSDMLPDESADDALPDALPDALCGVLTACEQALAAARESHWYHLTAPVTDVLVDALWRLGRTDDARQVLQDHIASYRVGRQVELHNRSEQVRLAMSRERSIETNHSDELTGVRNRRYLELCIPEATAANDVASVAVLNLDHFGTVNQRHGYVAGDLVLQEVATMLERVCRRGDVVARLEKDHFAMVLRGASLGDARRVFERVRQMIASRVWSALPSDYRLTASIGVTVASSGVDVGEVLAAATAAMEASQRAGRDQLTLG